MLRNLPIRRKVMAMLLLTSGMVLLITCMTFIGYEYHEFRRSMVRNVTTLGRVLANNGTAALAFSNQEDAEEILVALKAEPDIVAAAFYDADNRLFARYPTKLDNGLFPALVDNDGYRFQESSLVAWMPVKQDNNPRLGTLYLRADEHSLYKQLQFYSLIAAAVTALAFFVAYLLASMMQAQISRPLTTLVGTAIAVSNQRDYSIRATRIGNDEFGQLTDSFNLMLARIQQQDNEVSESRELLHAIIETAIEGIVTIDEYGQIESFNAAASSMFGYTAEQVVGQNIKMLMPQQYAEHHADYLNQYLRTGEKRIIGSGGREVLGLRRSGNVFPMELSVVEVRLNGRRKFSGFVRDITQRKEADSILQAQLARLALLNRITRATAERQDLQSIFQVVVRSLEQDLPLDFACICLYDQVEQQLRVTSVGVNSAALALELAMTEQAQIPIDKNGLLRCVQGHLVYEKDVSTSTFPFPIRLSAGGLRSLVIAPLLAESIVFGVLVAARRVADAFSTGESEFLGQLSEHVALAAHNAQLYGALQRAYEDLRQSQHTILQQERLRALGQMASGVAHDINNAISPVALYTESLLEREPGLSDRARSYLVTIQRAIEDVSQTVSRMRDFYRPREPQLSLSYIDLNIITQQVIDLTRARWRDVPQQRGVVIDLHTDFDPKLAKIMGAEHEIRDALTNLVFNAVDAMPHGGQLILRTRMSSQLDHDSTNTVLLEVIDSGIGMDEDTRQRCLEPFFTTKGERGTGLGLAMVYGMVKRHSAELQIDSTPDHGTTMRIVFAVATQTILDPESPTASQLRLRLLSLLIIDDDPVIIESLSEVLRRDGHQVTVANGGASGIETFKKAYNENRVFDAVMTDLGMPYVDGRAVAKAIKMMAPTTPVILLTGWGQRLMADNDIPAHVDRVLNKPPKLDELRRALLALVKTSTESKI